MDDENLIRRIKAGDADAMDKLIQKYYGVIYAYCFRKTGNKDDAQDITQETFLHFCRNFDSYVLCASLFFSAFHLSKDFMKRRQREFGRLCLS